jgi:enoyl-CoA hydratase/carnithine racemase
VHLRLDRDSAELVIDNPAARNAITLQMMVQLADAVAALRSSPAGSLTIRATGPVFCSGGHLGQVRKAVSTPHRAAQMCTAMSVVLDGLLTVPQISVCWLQGPAIGGGAELCMAADFRIGGPAASVHFVHSQLGIAPGWGGTARLVRHIGRKAALRILAEGRKLDVEQAQSMGLVDALDDGDGAWEAPWADKAPEAMRAVKAQVLAAEAGLPASAAQAFAEVWGSTAHVRALDALQRHQR